MSQHGAKIHNNQLPSLSSPSVFLSVFYISVYFYRMPCTEYSNAVITAVQSTRMRPKTTPPSLAFFSLSRFLASETMAAVAVFSLRLTLNDQRQNPSSLLPAPFCVTNGRCFYPDRGVPSIPTERRGNATDSCQLFNCEMKQA